MWEIIDKNKKTVHYSVMKLIDNYNGLDALRTMFPNGEVDFLNFVLFSTSGVHGTYNTIENAEDFLNGKNKDGYAEITYLIVHPRLVALRYAVCNPQNQDDIDFLKKLRENSKKAILNY